MDYNPQVPSSASPQAEADRLALIHAGVEVFDRLGKKVGKVDEIYAATSGTVAAAAPAPAAETLAASPVTGAPVLAQAPGTTEVFSLGNDLPREVRERLKSEGYIRIDAGLLHHHRYALSGQVDQVYDDHVSLKVVAEDLIKH